MVGILSGNIRESFGSFQNCQLLEHYLLHQQGNNFINMKTGLTCKPVLIMKNGSKTIKAINEK